MLVDHSWLLVFFVHNPCLGIGSSQNRIVLFRRCLQVLSVTKEVGDQFNTVLLKAGFTLEGESILCLLLRKHIKLKTVTNRIRSPSKWE